MADNDMKELNLEKFDNVSGGIGSIALHEHPAQKVIEEFIVMCKYEFHNSLEKTVKSWNRRSGCDYPDCWYSEGEQMIRSMYDIV